MPMTKCREFYEFVSGIFDSAWVSACEWLFRFPDRSIGPVEKFHATLIEDLPNPVCFRPVLAGSRLVSQVDVFFYLFGRDCNLGVGEPAFLKPFHGIAQENAESPAHVFEGGHCGGQDAV